MLAEGWASVTCRPSLKSAVVWEVLIWSSDDRRLTTVLGLPRRTNGDLSGEGCYERPRPGGAWLSMCGEALRGPKVATGTESAVVWRCLAGPLKTGD